jgi:hypothetical protein
MKWTEAFITQEEIAQAEDTVRFCARIEIKGTGEARVTPGEVEGWKECTSSC